RLATEQAAGFVLGQAASPVLQARVVEADLEGILVPAPCDVGMLVQSRERPASAPVVTPFGGAEHDWSAIEAAARLAQSLGTVLRLLRTEGDPAEGRRRPRRAPAPA